MSISVITVKGKDLSSGLRTSASTVKGYRYQVSLIADYAIETIEPIICVVLLIAD